MTFANINLDIIFGAPVPCASARLELKITNTFSYTAHATVVIAEASATTDITLNLNLNLPKGLSLPSTLQHLLLAVHGEELTLTSYRKNSVGKFFIRGGGTDVSATSISFETNKDLYTYTLRFDRNVLFTTVCVELMYMKQMLKAPIGSLILCPELYERVEPTGRIYQKFAYSL